MSGKKYLKKIYRKNLQSFQYLVELNVIFFLIKLEMKKNYSNYLRLKIIKYLDEVSKLFKISTS